MITGILEMRNFLKDPDSVVELAKSATFYPLESHPKTLDPNDTQMAWEGMRSDSIYKFNLKLSEDLFHEMFSRIARESVGSDDYSLQYEYYGNSSFHYMTSDNVCNDSWLHSDDGSIFAGVLYLNKDAQKEMGTTIFVGNTPVEIANEYNKLVVYPAHFKHFSSSGFGTTVDDARLTIAFFVSNVGFRLNCRQQS